MPLALSRPSWQTVKRGLASDTTLIVSAMVFQNLLRIVSSMALTRLLTASDFAVVAIITSILVTIALVSDIGVTAFIVRHDRTVEREFRDEVWTLRLIRGIALSTITAVVALPVARFIGRPDLAWAIAIAGLGLVLDSLGSLAPFIALRSRRIRKMTAIEVGSHFIGTFISIGMAALFRSYWGMIVSGFIAQVMGVVLSYLMYPDSRHRWRFSRERSRELWKFSRFITGSTILTLIITQGDKLVLTRALSLEMLGLYVIAAGLAAAPVAMVQAYTSKVTYPLLAQVRRESPEAMADQFYHHRRLPTVLYAFAAGGLIGCAPLVITVLYDPRYQGAGVILQIMAISTFFTMGNTAANEAMIALGRTRFTFLTNVIRLSYLVVGGFVGWYLLGPMGIVWAVGTVELIAQVFASIQLRREGLLNLRWEGAILLIGGMGFAVGSLVEMIGHSVISL